MEYMALGCMSGTSLDGIDCSLIKSDGLSFANEISNEFIPYSKELQKKLLNTISQEYLNDTSVLTLLNEEYKKAINQFIKNNNVKIDLIAMHGQTIFHDQKTKISIQLFDKSLSFDSNSPVICNFRKNDLLNGGNGAPIMPEFHKMIAMQLDLKKVIFVNIGGVTNITLINNEDINAGDSSFGNAIINDQIKPKNQFITCSGRLNFELVQKVLMTNIGIMIGVGAPTSLAIDLANKFDMTLIGFVKKDSFNVYTNNKKVIVD